MLILGLKSPSYLNHAHEYVIYGKDRINEYSIFMTFNSNIFALRCNKVNDSRGYPESFNKVLARGLSMPASDIQYIHFALLKEGSYRRSINDTDLQWATNFFIILPNFVYEKISIKSRCEVEHLTYLYFFLNSMFGKESDSGTTREIANMLNIIRSNVRYYGTSRSDRVTYRMIKNNPILFISRRIHPIEDENDFNLSNERSSYLSTISYAIRMRKEHYRLVEERIKNFFVYVHYDKGDSANIVCFALKMVIDLYESGKEFDTFKLVVGVRGDLITLMNKSHFFRSSSPLYWCALFLSQMAMSKYLENGPPELGVHIPRENYHEINIKEEDYLSVLEITPIFLVYDSYRIVFNKCFGVSLDWNDSITLIIYYIGDVDAIYSYVTSMNKKDLKGLIIKEINGKKPHLVGIQDQINGRHTLAIFWFEK